MPFHARHGFLKFVPDVRRTPSTKVVSPENYDAVLRAFETAETLVNHQEKVDSLYALLMEV